MPTRLKRPSIVKQLGYTLLLAGFLVYMGFSVISGQYGMNSQSELRQELAQLKANNAGLLIKKDALKHKVALFNPERLDPDILTERARDLLVMVHKNDRIVVTSP